MVLERIKISLYLDEKKTDNKINVMQNYTTRHSRYKSNSKSMFIIHDPLVQLFVFYSMRNLFSRINGFMNIAEQNKPLVTVEHCAIVWLIGNQLLPMLVTIRYSLFPARYISIFPLQFAL